MEKAAMRKKTSSNSQLPLNTSSKGLNHTLHLYTPNVDKYTIQKAFLISARNDEKIVYVTTDDLAPRSREFNLTNAELKIIKPEEIKDLENEENCELRLIIDAGSIVNRKDAEVEERESYLNELSKKRHINCLCTYDVAKLEPEKIQQLTAHHNQLRLTTSDLTILSGEFLDGSKLSGDSIEKIVRDDLETIVLAILQKKTMCGTEIIGTVHLKFNVLLSPGTIYPLLHSLTQRGLLTSKKNGNEKVYAPADGAKLKIRSIVNECIHARKLLNHYLQQETTI